jgi:hypothetical protein
MRQCQPERAASEGAVVRAAVIFQPRGMCSILVKVLRADVVMLAGDHEP